MAAAAFVTDLADQAVLLPLALAVALVLAALGWRRAALAWAASVAATFGTVLALKLGLAACGPTLAGTVRSPSGHTAAAAMVYGGLAGLLLRRGAPATLFQAALLPAIIIAVLIGATRVWLGAHTLAETVLGGLLGCAGAAAFLRLTGPRPAATRPAWLLLPLLLVPWLAHGRNLGAEPHIHALGLRLAGFLPAGLVSACAPPPQARP